MITLFLSITLLALVVMIRGQRLIQKRLHFLTKQIITSMSNTSQTLEQIKAQLTKAKGEIVGKIQALTDAVNNNQDNLSPESQQALEDLQNLAQQFDDIVPDAPAEEPTADQPAA